LEYFLYNVALGAIVFMVTRNWSRPLPWYAIPNWWMAMAYFTGLPHKYLDHVGQLKKDDWLHKG